MISETEIDSYFPKGQFHLLDLTEMEMVVEYLCLFVKKYSLKL